MDIDLLRLKINEIDEQILTLIQHRVVICSEIGEIKRQHKLPIYQPIREKELLKNLSKKSTFTSDETIEKLFRPIIDLCCDVQLNSTNKE